MNQAQMQDATDQARKKEKEGGVFVGLAVWAFIAWALYRYFFG
ncbi:MAG: hypothetical protein AB7E59_09505 [Pusillimonas sp.]